ncbi:MAG: orotidine-5'-phosphate decarboxylase [Candidatus Micrarchaeota archaeon]
MVGFLEKYLTARNEKQSVLCVGIDPVSHFLNPEKNSIDRHYFEDTPEVDGMFNFCMDIIENVSDYCCAIKPNMQFVMPFSLDMYRKMNALAHKHGLVTILDNKLGDIGSSNKSSFYWVRQAGFDALTFSPFAGNISEASAGAHDAGVGLIVLTLMSNPDSKYFMRESSVGGTTGYSWIAQQIGKTNADGAVVGATHTKKEEVMEIRKGIGNDAVILIPGVGAQGGDLSETIDAFGRNILVNVGRSVIYSQNPNETAKKYNGMVNRLVDLGD